MKTILITGAAGFLGTAIARHFAQAGWRIVGVDVAAPENARLPAGARYERMQLPSPALGALLAETTPEVCIHAAGRASVPLSMREPAADFSENVALTFHILDALRQHASKCRFILLSSAAVYGNPRDLPVSEKAHVGPLSPYGFHKRQAELLCQEFARIYGVPALAVRIFSAYGPGLRRQVVWDICERVLTTGTLQLGGDGGESRDFIHATDIARALAVLAEKAPAEGEIYNVASGQETTIAALATQLVTLLGGKTTPQFDRSTRPGDPRNWRADTSKIAQLGWQPAIPLAQGLAQVAAWARAELG